ncbi:MAG: tRNA pseudouridine(13) synthase TruD [Phycisphaerae bacterium]
MIGQYLTEDMPGIGGLIKQATTDFIVEEIPLYEAAGEGTHAYIFVEKEGVTTFDAIRILAKALGRRNFDIGYGGLKDARAITRQWFSIEHEDPERLKELKLPRLKILAATRHRNKIKLGHLGGNRFDIKIRNPEWSRVDGGLTRALGRARAIMHRLGETGVPNYYGPQRFGMRGDNHALGLALMRGDYKDFLDHFLGKPDEKLDHAHVLAGRTYYEAGEYAKAVAAWPGHMGNERRALSVLIASKGSKRAVDLVDSRLKDLFLSALQSHLFNAYLTLRLPAIDQVWPGDMCMKHDNGACFHVENTPEAAAVEQVRCASQEISPTGPLYGRKLSRTAGRSGELETQVLAEAGIKEEDAGSTALGHGARRALRFFAREPQMQTGQDDNGPYLRVQFALNSGCYATVLLSEIMKTDVDID